MSIKILEAIAVAAELTNTELSKGGLLAMESDLASFPEHEVLHALTRCRRELTGRLTLAAILERLQEADGRPNADEAWAVACCADDEAETVIWTGETAEAFYAARPLLGIGDKIGARMAFRDSYNRIVRQSREQRIPVEWKASLGWDKDKRREMLTKAVELGRLPGSFAAGLLPPPEDGGIICGLLANTQTLRLVGKDDMPVLPAEEIAARIDKLKQMMKGAA